MALWVCGGKGGCGTKYAVGLSRCPRCHNTEFFEDGDPMAKISRHGGASDKTLPTPEVESAAAAETDSTPEAAADQTEIASADKRVEIDLGASGEWLDVTEDLAGPPAPVVEGGEEPSPEPDYEAWTVEQLKERLGARGLPKSGKRDDLVLRLLEDDDKEDAP